MRRILASIVASAMLFGLPVGASAAGHGATVWVAHGIPGAKVDVCVSGTEVRSNFKYGNAFALKGVPAGKYNIKVFLANPNKECRGTLVIQQRVKLTDGLNATAVAKLYGGGPSLDIFVNDVGLTDQATVTVRHTASAPKVDVWVNGGKPLVEDLRKGNEAGPVGVGQGVYSYWVSLPDGYAPVIGPDVAMLESGMVYQILAVGTKASNYRFIVIGQAGIVP